MSCEAMRSSIYQSSCQVWERCTLIGSAGADGHLSGVQVLIATAITGVTQAVIGGQPLLIIGVAEPIILVYSFMYQFAKGQLIVFCVCCWDDGQW